MLIKAKFIKKLSNFKMRGTVTNRGGITGGAPRGAGQLRGSGTGMFNNMLA